MDPSSNLRWDYSNVHTPQPTLNQLLRSMAGRRWSLPLDMREDSSSVKVTAERDRSQLIMTIDVDVEDAPPGWKGWSKPFLHLSVSFQLDPFSSPISQKQIGSYLTYDGREVDLTKEYQRKIERYTKKKLWLQHVNGQWQLHSLESFRRVIARWELVQYLPNHPRTMRGFSLFSLARSHKFLQIRQACVQCRVFWQF